MLAIFSFPFKATSKGVSQVSMTESEPYHINGIRADAPGLGTKLECLQFYTYNIYLYINNYKYELNDI